jgi:hypothetical protein
MARTKRACLHMHMRCGHKEFFVIESDSSGTAHADLDHCSLYIIVKYLSVSRGDHILPNSRCGQYKCFSANIGVLKTADTMQILISGFCVCMCVCVCLHL